MGSRYAKWYPKTTGFPSQTTVLASKWSNKVDLDKDLSSHFPSILPTNRKYNTSLSVWSPLKRVIFRKIIVVTTIFVNVRKRSFIYCLYRKKDWIGYKWLEHKKWRNICHWKLSFHLEDKINEFSQNSREELFTKQAIIQTLLSTISQQQ